MLFGIIQITDNSFEKEREMDVRNMVWEVQNKK